MMAIDSTIVTSPSRIAGMNPDGLMAMNSVSFLTPASRSTGLSLYSSPISSSSHTTRNPLPSPKTVIMSTTPFARRDVPAAPPRQPRSSRVHLDAIRAEAQQQRAKCDEDSERIDDPRDLDSREVRLGQAYVTHSSRRERLLDHDQRRRQREIRAEQEEARE